MKNRINRTGSILSLIILIAATGSLQAKGKFNRNSKQGPVWMSELNLSAEQMKDINQLRDDMQPAIMDIRHKTRVMEMELKRLSRSGKTDSKAATNLKKSIKANNQSISALQQAHRAQIRSLLNPDQQSSFDTYGKRMGAPRGKGKSRSNRCEPMNGQGQGRWNRG